MSVYFVEGRGWRFDFTLMKTRHTGAWFKTKVKALQAEAKRREGVEELNQAQLQGDHVQIPTDMGFLELVNERLDYVKTHNSPRHYEEYCYVARRWTARWGDRRCSQISRDMIEDFVLARSKVSAHTANKEIRYLRATFNFGVKRDLIAANPTKGVDFLPVEKRVKHVPSPEEIGKVLSMADQDARDYLLTIMDTLARVGEVNRLVWEDVDFGGEMVMLYTRKKRGGNLTPRSVPMTHRLYQVLSRRYERRDSSKPWVFWHRYWDKDSKTWVEGPYGKRYKLLSRLCRDAEVRPFGFHALRHAGASLLDSQNVPLGTIQRILGHENRTTTEIYLHSIGQPEREAMEAFERASRHVAAESHTGSHTGHQPESHTAKKRVAGLRLVKG